MRKKRTLQIVLFSKVSSATAHQSENTINVYRVKNKVETYFMIVRCKLRGKLLPLSPLLNDWSFEKRERPK